MPPRVSLPILIVGVLIVAIGVVILYPTVKSTTDTVLYSNGATSGTTGTYVTPGYPNGTSPPPAAQPSPPPTPTSKSLGTYTVLATVSFTDGTSATLTGTKTFTTAPYYAGKQVSSFRYTGSFKADQDLVAIAGSYQHSRVEVYDSAGRYFFAYDPNVPTQIGAGQSAQIFDLTVVASSAFPSTTPIGPVSLYFTAHLEFVYSKNATRTPQFLLTNPTVGIIVQDTSSLCCGSGSSAARPIAVVRVDSLVYASFLK